jgi:hypothetical protein
MKQLAGGKHMENDCFPRTLKFKMFLCNGKDYLSKKRCTKISFF